MILRLSFIFFVFSLLFVGTQAQGPSSSEPANAVIKRPRIGLALDSGGALGLAHVGVIQWMEEHRIPVHYVAGTSMGGLIGGAYATGMSSSDLRKLVGSIDWTNTVFNGEPQYRDLTFRQKEDQRDYPNAMELGLNHGVQMPNGLNSGINVDRVIIGFSLPYSNAQSFDDLPIPFRCVATDLNSGELHIFHNGVLGDALRATMSIPGIFEPVRIGDGLYVDGTLLDPLPSDVARDMGADVVIAVFLESYVKNKTPQSPFGALFRSLEAVTLNNEQRGIQQASLVIRVPLLDYNNLQYDKWETLVDLGYREAEKNSAALLKYALTESEWKEYVGQRESRRKPMPAPRKIQFNGDTVVAESRGLTALQGQTVSASKVDAKVEEIAGERLWERIEPAIGTDAAGNAVLNFRASAKEYGPVLVRPLVLLDGSDYNNVRFSLGARIIVPDMVMRGSETRTDFMLGSTYKFASEYLMPVMGSRHWFTATRAGFENGPQDFYSRHGKIAEYRRIETVGGFDVGYTFNRANELRAGFQVGWLKYSSEMGTPLVPDSFRGTQRAIRLRYTLDRLDDPTVPTRGVGLDSLFLYYDRRAGTAESIPTLELKIQGYHPFTENGSIYAICSAGSTFGFQDTGFPLFALGSSTRFAAYGANEILTNQYWLAQAGYIHKLAALPPMSGKNLYLTSGLEVGKAFYTGTVSSLPMDLRVAIIAQTLLGPVQVGTAFGDTGHRKFFLQIGRVF
ncbi:MAG: patatin-like phospholipase family protein [Acidobacteriaceae bacterium]